MLPEGLQAFSRLPFWGYAFVGLAAGLVAGAAWSLWRRPNRQNFYYVMLGLYLLVTLPVLFFPSVATELGVDTTHLWLGTRLAIAMPAIVLFVMGVRAR